MLKMFDMVHPKACEALARTVRYAGGPERLTCLRLDDENYGHTSIIARMQQH